MKRTIPFDLFGEKQELCFTIGTLIELERTVGKSLQQIVNSQNAGFDFCVTTLPICLKRISQDLYVKKIENYLLGADGRSLDDIAIPIIHAIVASGALGKEASDRIMAKYYPELYKAPLEDEEIKND